MPCALLWLLWLIFVALQFYLITLAVQELHNESDGIPWDA
jgi:hypothetical protein